MYEILDASWQNPEQISWLMKSWISWSAKLHSPVALGFHWPNLHLPFFLASWEAFLGPKYIRPLTTNLSCDHSWSLWGKRKQHKKETWPFSPGPSVQQVPRDIKKLAISNPLTDLDDSMIPSNLVWGFTNRIETTEHHFKQKKHYTVYIKAYNQVQTSNIISWNSKQPFINGCLVKQPFSM